MCALFLLSGFDWSLHFKWEPLTEAEKSRRINDIDPIR